MDILIIPAGDPSSVETGENEEWVFDGIEFCHLFFAEGSGQLDPSDGAFVVEGVEDLDSWIKSKQLAVVDADLDDPKQHAKSSWREKYE